VVLPTAGARLSDYERAVLAGEVSMVLGRDADIGELSSGNLVYAKEAIYKGSLVYSRDEAYTRLMATSLLSMYASFNEERREVLDAWRD